MKDIAIVGRWYGTLAERQVIDSIEQVCLSHAIAAYETIYLWRQRNVDVSQIPIIQYWDTIQLHRYNVLFYSAKIVKTAHKNNRIWRFYNRDFSKFFLKIQLKRYFFTYNNTSTTITRLQQSKKQRIKYFIFKHLKQKKLI